MALDKSERGRITRTFNNAMWIFFEADWYWLQASRRVMFRCQDRQGEHYKPVPRGATFIGRYSRGATKDFLDDLDDIIVLCERRGA